MPGPQRRSAQIDALGGALRARRPAPAALHVDTGMARLGLRPPTSSTRWSPTATRCDGVALALRDEPPRLRRRAGASAEPRAARAVPRGAGTLTCRAPQPRSLAASSGIFLGPDYHFDLVRPGAALYGVEPLAGPAQSDAPSRSAARQKSCRSGAIDAGRPLVMVRRTASTRPARLATVGVGYADGFLRALGNRGGVYRRRPAACRSWAEFRWI